MKYEIPKNRLLSLIDKYITTSYPTAKKMRIVAPDTNVEITSFSKENPQDENDHLIIKYLVFGQEQRNILPNFLELIESMFGKDMDVEDLVYEWFDNKEVDDDMVK